MKKKTLILTVATLGILGVSPFSNALMLHKASTSTKMVLSIPPKSSNGYELGCWIAANIALGENQSAKVKIANSVYSKLDHEQKIKSLASVPSITKHLDYKQVRRTISIAMLSSGNDFKNSIAFDALKSIVEYSHGDKGRLAVIKGDFHDLAPGLFFDLAPGLFSGL